MMPPERPKPGFAALRHGADSVPEGALSTGLLQRPFLSLLQRARHPPFYLLLPRVHAADGASSPSSTRYMGRPELPDTGWDRIKDLFNRDATQQYPEELTSVIKSGVTAALMGLIYGGLPAARHARQRYIQLNQAEVYTSRVDAVRSAHNAAIRGFVRYGLRWSWRVGVFVTVFNSVSTGLSVYRDEYTLGHYAAAGAVTGGLFRLNLGLGGLVAGAVIGAILGVPTGALIIGMQSLGGETIQERRRRERRELHQLRIAEWTARLQLTDELIGDLNVSSQPEETRKDTQRIEELLSLTPSDAAAPGSSRQG